VNPARPEREQR